MRMTAVYDDYSCFDMAVVEWCNNFDKNDNPLKTRFISVQWILRLLTDEQNDFCLALPLQRLMCYQQ